MRFKRIFCLLLTFTLIIGLFPNTIKAEMGYTDASIEIPVSIAHEGVAVSETNVIQMNANDDSTPMPNGKTGGSCTINTNGDGKFYFPAITYNHPWHYTYTIKQHPGNHPLAVAYDENIYNLNVNIYNKDGKLTIYAKMNKSDSKGKSDVAAFTNIYVLPAVAKDDPQVNVSAGNNTNETFTYEITPEGNSIGLDINNMPLFDGSVNGKKTITVSPGQPVGFGEIVFSAPGTYTYRVKPVKNKDGYDYDDSTYLITYTVVRDGDRLVYTCTITKNGNNIDSISFTNTPKKVEKKKNKEPSATFSILKFHSSKQGKHSITLKWKKVAKAKKYVLYGNKCNTKKKTYKIKKIKTVKTNHITMKTIFGKRLKKGTYYKFYIVALDENNKKIYRSKTLHVCTKGGKDRNNKKVKITSPKSKKLTLKVGEKKRIKAKPTGKHVKIHIALRYESTDKSIAKVTKGGEDVIGYVVITNGGEVTGLKKGTCKIYVYAQNGKYTTVNVTVK